MTLRARLVRLIAACLLLLPVVQAQAQNLIWERPRNALTLPVSGATAVEIYLPQSELYTEVAAMIPMLAGGATAAVAAILESKDKAATERVRAAIPALDFDKLLKEAFSRHVDAGHITTITGVAVHHGEPADIEAAAPGSPDEQVLALRFRYHFAPGLSSLRIAVTARLGARKVVTSAPEKNLKPLFSQEIVYEVPGGAGAFSLPGTRYQVWFDMGGAAIAGQIANGIDDVMAMLARELGTQPRFGRIPGKQLAWSTSYGVTEKENGARDWVRMRNGYMVSLPSRSAD